MSEESDKHFSFPNSDRPIPGVTGPGAPKEEPAQAPTRPTVNIFQALDSQKHKEADLQKIHTFQEDMASAIKNDNLSMIKMALAEKKRQERQGAPAQEEEGNSKKYILIGGIALVALIFIIGIVVVISNAIGGSGEPASQVAVQQPLMYTEERSVIDTTSRDSDDLTRLIRREMDSPPELGAMRAITLTTGSGTSTREITSGEFFTGMQTYASDSLLRALNPQFLLGLYAFSPNDFFILLTVNTYDNAFAGMLQWEPDMENDLGKIMITRKPIVPITVLTKPNSTSTEVTTTPQQTGGRIWVDRVVNNKDARVLIDTEGNPAMLYTFLDKQTLVIASSEKALKEIMFRLTAGRITR